MDNGPRTNAPVIHCVLRPYSTKDKKARIRDERFSYPRVSLRPWSFVLRPSRGGPTMPFKFENLDVWHLALDYIDRIYDLADQLPRSEDFNLTSQIRRAATSVALNIAEGSTGQTDAEQARFLGMALRSLIETVACP